eukprot:Nitzschia sp. Nitz4//scaffold2_size372955//81578//82756//NITZ4_000382-RA/size372955-processed-gene-0.481-mRNA-1//-1//CDS//3329546653//4270//frame0
MAPNHTTNTASTAEDMNDGDSMIPVNFHVVGDAYVDFFCFLDDGGWPESGGDSRLEHPVQNFAGGSSTNTATHLRALLSSYLWTQPPPHVYLHTVLNPDDHYGQILLQHAQNHNFPIINCTKSSLGLSTGHCIAIVSGGERSFMTHQGCVGQFSAHDLNVDQIVHSPGDVHVHVAGFYNIPGFWDSKLESKLKEIRLRRKELFPNSLTTMSLVSQHDATKKWDGGFDALLPYLDFAIMNDLEARNIVRRGRRARGEPESTLSQMEEIEHWAAYFGSVSPDTNIIVTRGELGAVALKGGQLVVNQPTLAVKPVDPTGAGDSFTAGFLYGVWTWRTSSAIHPTDPWSVEALVQGLRWGCAVGRAAVLIRGASIPPAPEGIEKFRQTLEEHCEEN